MSAKDDIRKTYDKLAAEVAAMDAEAAPLIASAKELQAKIEPLKGELREISKKVIALRGPEYAEKKKLLGQLAVALGGKVLKAEPMA